MFYIVGRLKGLVHTFRPQADQHLLNRSCSNFDQIGRFLKRFGNKFSSKDSQIICQLKGLF